jgi:V8-like Glu-specific endopeptidase
MEFNEIQQQLVKVLIRIPELQRFNSRTSLLDGLPPAPLNRDESSAPADLRSIISGLEKLGRLTKEGGMRPVIVVVNNALSIVPEGSEIAGELQKIKQQLEEHYGGDIQPEPEQPVTSETLEALPFAFIEQAQRTAQSVTRLTVPRIFNSVADGKAVYGTGWIIAPGILITNHHVIEARDPIIESPAQPADFEAQAQGVVARFDYHVEQAGTAFLECKNAKLLDAHRDLDYAILELTEADKIADRKPLRLVPVQPTLARGARINIVQHPQGGPLLYAIRNNFFVRPGDKPPFVWYQTDTERGASGSPICNDDWQVVALHHASTPVASQIVPQEVTDGRPVTVTVLNEAIKIHEILNNLPTNVRQRIDVPQAMR